MKGKIRWIPVLCFAVLMLGLGSSDSLRGIFSPVFGLHYGISDAGLSMMVVISYVGNLVFLSVGGKMLDRFDRKKVAIGMVGIWLFAILLNLVTDAYPLILISMFLALGASTLLNTTINLLTPTVCAGYAGLMVNLFFFIQGIGTSGSQFMIGRYAFSYEGWKGVNLLLLIVGLVALILFFFVKLDEKTETGAGKDKSVKEAKAIEKQAPCKAVFWMLAAMLGCYFIGEHGIMNWMLSYCMGAFAMPSERAATFLSVFWGGMTLGRLVFAPVVQKLGVQRSLRWFGGAGTLLFVLGIVLGAHGVLLLSASGFLISIIYPTTILFFQEIYPTSMLATKTGAIISAATIADILFNTVFGVLTDTIGIRMSFFILPICMFAFYLLYLLLPRVLKKS